MSRVARAVVQACARERLDRAELAAADASPRSIFGIYFVGSTLEAFGSSGQDAEAFTQAP